jgi:hypothetical protein
MEIILAIVVASAVIFFGALISMGNERQRKAIDGLREQIIVWALQDLKIKREHLGRTVQIPDPLEWLNIVAAKVCGYDLKLQVLEIFEDPQSLICTSGDGSVKIIFSPLSPTDIHRIMSNKQNRLSQFTRHNPLLHLPKGRNVYELSILNGSHLFDLELPLAWKALTGQNLEPMIRFWMYEYS